VIDPNPSRDVRRSRKLFKRFRLELPLQSLFQSPPVADMEKRPIEEELERILTEVESMSEEEAKKLVAEHGK
jgi:hypothetical protein